MPYGMEIINDYGTILLDHSYNNLAMVSKGSVTTARDSPASEDVAIYSAYIGTALLSGERLAIACSTAFATFFCETDAVYVCTGGATAVVEWYRFGTPAPSTTNNAGLRVYNASGQLTFDSNHNQARVHSSVTSEAATPVGTTGRKYAVILARRGHGHSTVRLPDPIVGGFYNTPILKATGVKIDGVNVSFGRVTWSSTGGGTDFESPAFRAHIIDVTGY